MIFTVSVSPFKFSKKKGMILVWMEFHQHVLAERLTKFQVQKLESQGTAYWLVVTHQPGAYPLRPIYNVYHITYLHSKSSNEPWVLYENEFDQHVEAYKACWLINRHQCCGSWRLKDIMGLLFHARIWEHWQKGFIRWDVIRERATRNGDSRVIHCQVAHSCQN